MRTLLFQLQYAKNMKRFLFLFCCLFTGFAASSQELFQVTLSGGSQLSHFTLLTDREVLIRVSDDGRILEWGLEIQSMRNNNYYAPKLQPYLGRVDYYGNESDSVSRGKVRSIGSSVITYYGAYETPEKIGKIRSVGSLILDYYSNYDGKDLKGKLRSIGSANINYYTSFEDRDLVGKLRSVGAVTLTYYSFFDDKLIRGKVKSIGPFNYAWYTSLDRNYGGGLKTGSFRQSIGGVMYIVQ